MKHTTKELYNMCPSEFKDLPYQVALEKKITGAIASKIKYAQLAKDSMSEPDIYKQWLEKYNASDDAVDHNRKLLHEIKQEEENELNDYECEGRVLPDQRTTYQSNYGETGNTSLLIRFWKWLNSLFP